MKINEMWSSSEAKWKYEMNDIEMKCEVKRSKLITKCKVNESKSRNEMKCKPNDNQMQPKVTKMIIKLAKC